MYIKVFFGDRPRGESGGGDQKIPTEVLINPDCPIRVIYDFIRKTFQVSDEYELDLCDETGNLMFLYEKVYWMYGLNYFTAKSTYFVVLYESMWVVVGYVDLYVVRHVMNFCPPEEETNRVTNPLVCLPESMRKTSVQWNEFISTIKKQLNPTLCKPSRMSKTRCGSSCAK